MKENQSIHKIWWNQLKTIGRELLRLLQKYVQSMNEKKNFEHRIKNEEDYDNRHKITKLESKTRENFEDSWIKSWNNDNDLVNDMFGFDKPKKKGKKHQRNDYEFNMEDFFS